MNVAINGFGRIGRAAFKILWSKKDVNIVAVNDLGDIENLVYLLKFDSVYGRWKKDVVFEDGVIRIGKKEVNVYSEKNPASLPWEQLKVDVVIESTGIFTRADAMRMHKDAGARMVILSAPAKGEGVQTVVKGVSERTHEEGLYSNASCTTNCVSPVSKVIHENFGILRAGLTTIHAYTSGQGLVDAPAPPRKSDYRRGRAAAINMVPTTTGAAKATTKVIPELQGMFDGMAIRVPVVAGSLSDLTFLVEKHTSEEEVLEAFRQASKKGLKGVLEVSDEPLVSSDIVGSTASAIIDAEFIRVMGGDFIKILAWYDNEWGYANRLAEMVVKIGSMK